jgi:hypothetical protein
MMMELVMKKLVMWNSKQVLLRMNGKYLHPIYLAHLKQIFTVSIDKLFKQLKNNSNIICIEKRSQFEFRNDEEQSEAALQHESSGAEGEKNQIEVNQDSLFK